VSQERCEREEELSVVSQERSSALREGSFSLGERSLVFLGGAGLLKHDQEHLEEEHDP
jgi:hypothetical protein